MKNDIQVVDSLQVSFNDFNRDTCMLVHVKTCNLNCAYCFNMPVFRGCKTVSFKQALFPKIVSYIKRHNLPNNITISGGEPTMENGLIDVLAFLKKRNFNVRLYTNGTNPDKIEEALPYISSIGIDIKAPLLDIYKKHPNFNFSDISTMLFGKSQYGDLKLDEYIDNVKSSIRVLVNNKFNHMELRTTFNDILIRDSEKVFIILADFIHSIDDYLNSIIRRGSYSFDYFIQKATPTDNVSNKYTECKSDLKAVYEHLDRDLYRRLNIKVR